MKNEIALICYIIKLVSLKIEIL